MPRYTTQPPVPVDALRLAEDILVLRQVLRLLDTLDVASLAEDPLKGRKIVRYCTGQLKQAERHAQSVMRTRYLDPRKKEVIYFERGKRKTV